MSRIAKEPILVPQGVEVSIDGQLITIKSKKGQMQLTTHDKVKVTFSDNALHVAVADRVC